VAGERLDEAKLETLRRWGLGLAEDPREEVRAAGRAILLLIEEVEHLHVDLWHAGETPAPEPDRSAFERAEQDLPADSLLRRIRGLRLN
jgi:hypothetical protein